MEEGSGTDGAAASPAMNVLMAIDDSNESFYALEWFLDKMVKPAGGGESSAKVLTLVTVIEPLPRYAFPSGYGVVETVSKTQEQNAAKVLSKAYEFCKERSVNAKTLILEGDPKDKICRSVDEMKINLLVVGSRGLGQIKRAFLGSVSDFCVHHAKCPVLVVKPLPTKKTDS